MSENPNKQYYNDFSGWYENERAQGYHAMIDRLELQVLIPMVANKDVLEVGCGTGLILKEVAKTAKTARGIDISPGMLEKARSRGLDVQEGVAEALPYEDESFDVVYSFKVLAHVEQIQQAMNDMVRVLRPGGILLAEFYNALSIRHLAKKLAKPGKISSDRTEAEVYTRYDTPRQVRNYQPVGTRFLGWRGVRVVTPFAGAIKLPLVGKAFVALEKKALDSQLARFGGFLIAMIEKQ